MKKILALSGLAVALSAGACARTQQPAEEDARAVDSYSDEDVSTGAQNRNIRDDDPALNRDEQLEQRDTGTEGIEGGAQDLTDDTVKERVQGLTDEDFKDPDTSEITDDALKQEADRVGDEIRTETDDSMKEKAQETIARMSAGLVDATYAAITATATNRMRDTKRRRLVGAWVSIIL